PACASRRSVLPSADRRHGAPAEGRHEEPRIMAGRSTETTVTFHRPFSLSAVERPLPAGRYRCVIDEEEISGLSFVAFRRSATLLHLPALSIRAQTSEVVSIDPSELDAAL